MRINPVSFQGIKNISYAKVNDIEDEPYHSRLCLNMELTNDKYGNDLNEYDKLLKTYPDLNNELYPSFVNIEFETAEIRPNKYIISLKLNGCDIYLTPKNSEIIGFMQKLIKKILNKKPDDFKTDRNYLNSGLSEYCPIYNESLGNYLFGTDENINIYGKNYTVMDDKLSEILDKVDDGTATGKEKKYIANIMNKVSAILHDSYYINSGVQNMKLILDQIINTNYS